LIYYKFYIYYHISSILKILHQKIQLSKGMIHPFLNNLPEKYCLDNLCNIFSYSQHMFNNYNGIMYIIFNLIFQNILKHKYNYYLIKSDFIGKNIMCILLVQFCIKYMSNDMAYIINYTFIQNMIVSKDIIHLFINAFII